MCFIFHPSVSGRCCRVLGEPRGKRQPAGLTLKVFWSQSTFFLFSHYENGFCSLFCRDTELIYSLSTESGCNKCCGAETRGVLRRDGRAQRPTVNTSLLFIPEEQRAWEEHTEGCFHYLGSETSWRLEMNWMNDLKHFSTDLRSIKHHIWFLLVFRTQPDLLPVFQRSSRLFLERHICPRSVCDVTPSKVWQPTTDE